MPVPANLAAGSARALGTGVYAVADVSGAAFVIKLECRPMLDAWRGAQAWADTVVSQIADVGGFERVACSRPCAFAGPHLTAMFPTNCVDVVAGSVAGACSAFIEGTVFGRPPPWVADVLTGQAPAAELSADRLRTARDVSSLLLFDFIVSNFDRVNAENWVRVDGRWFAMDNGLAWWHSGLCRCANDTVRYLRRPPAFDTHVHRRRRAAALVAAAGAAGRGTPPAPEAGEFCAFEGGAVEGARRLASAGGQARLRVALEANALLASLTREGLPAFQVPGYWQASLPVIDLAPLNPTCLGSIVRAVDACERAGIPADPARVVDMIVLSVASQARAVLEHVDACAARLGGVGRALLPEEPAAPVPVPVVATVAFEPAGGAPAAWEACVDDPRLVIEVPGVAPPGVLLPVRVSYAAAWASGAPCELRVTDPAGAVVLSRRFRLTRGVAVEVLALSAPGEHVVQARLGGWAGAAAHEGHCARAGVSVVAEHARIVWAAAAPVPVHVPAGTIVVIPAGAVLATGTLDVSGSASAPVVITTFVGGAWGGLRVAARATASHLWLVAAGNEAGAALEVAPGATVTLVGGGFVDCGGGSTVLALPGSHLALRGVALFRSARPPLCGDAAPHVCARVRACRGRVGVNATRAGVHISGSHVVDTGLGEGASAQRGNHSAVLVVADPAHGVVIEVGTRARARAAVQRRRVRAELQPRAWHGGRRAGHGPLQRRRAAGRVGGVVSGRRGRRRRVHGRAPVRGLRRAAQRDGVPVGRGGGIGACARARGPSRRVDARPRTRPCAHSSACWTSAPRSGTSWASGRATRPCPARRRLCYG